MPRRAGRPGNRPGTTRLRVRSPAGELSWGCRSLAEADAIDGVLVVEDEAPIALDLWSILAGLGCGVLGPAPSVPEALRLLATDPPDVVTLDLNLSGARAT